MPYPLKNDTDSHQYQMNVDGQTAFIEYIPEGDTLVLVHTEVPESLSGRGIGHQLVHETLDDIAAHGGHIIPTCPFIISYIQENPEYSKLIIP